MMEEDCDNAIPNEVETELPLRDLFAAMALCGMCGDPNREGDYENYAHDAYGMADAMLKERKK